MKIQIFTLQRISRVCLGVGAPRQLDYRASEVLLFGCGLLGLEAAAAGRPTLAFFENAFFENAFFENAFFENAFFETAFFENFANFWRARSRLYQNEILQENMRSTAFCKLYKICILLHRCNLKIFAKTLI